MRKRILSKKIAATFLVVAMMAVPVVQIGTFLFCTYANKKRP